MKFRRSKAIRALFSFAVFILFFFVEVRVKAEPLVTLPRQKEAIDEPVGCSEDLATTCALGTYPSAFYSYQREGFHLILGADSGVVWQDGQWVHLAGELSLNTQTNTKVKYEYGTVSVDSGQVWLIRTKRHLLIRNLSASVELFMRGRESFPLPPGFEIQISGVNEDGRVGMTVPTAIPYQDQLQRMARVNVESREEFYKTIENFKEVWKLGVEEAGELHAQLLQREIANTEAQAKAKELQQLRRARERAELRQLFRKKNYLD